MDRSKASFFSSRNQFPPQAGMYHYLLGEQQVHLRVERDHSAVMLVNAAKIYYFNPSAASMAWLILEKVPGSEAALAFSDAFDIKKDQADRDFLAFKGQLDALLISSDLCPICDLDLNLDLPFSHTPSAPYRMDLALTYRCNNNCGHCYNARPRNFPEMDTAKWKMVLDQVWSIGIPHVVFTGGEPTLRNDLVELVEYATKKGFITGLNTNGRMLKDEKVVKKLVDAGLDHVQITFESSNASIHNEMVQNDLAWQDTVSGIKNVLNFPIYVMTNTTMLKTNRTTIADTLEYLARIGVPTVGLNALIYSGRGLDVGTGLEERDLQFLLETARDITNRYGQKLIWYTPTQYCNFDPVEMNLGVKSCSAASYNMCIEPDGAVIPCQSYYQPIGNILVDPWESIWNHDLAISLRERKNLQTKCVSCAVKNECGGGCPLLVTGQDLKPISAGGY